MRHLTAAAAIWLRAARGGVAARRSSPPPQPKLFLYEYEGSPWCRRVREHVCQLDLKVNMRPCPREVFFSHVGPPLHDEGWSSSLSRFRPEVRGHGGQTVFPFLVDETQGVAMNGSGAIVRHLWEHYGGSVMDAAARPMSTYNLASFKSFAPLEQSVCVTPPSHVSWKILDVPTLILSSVVRPWPRQGVMLTPSELNATKRGSVAENPLDAVELYGHEACVGSRLLREALCSLQIPYALIPTAAGGQHRGSSRGTPLLRVGEEVECGDAEAGVELLFSRYAKGPTRSWFASKQ